MSSTTNSTDTRTAPPEPPALGPALAADGTIAAWVRQAMVRAREAGIDPRRVALALGIPLGALDTADEADVLDRSRR